MTQIIDKLVSFEDGLGDEKLHIKHEQHIPQSFLDRLKLERDASQHERMGDYHRLASIPVVVIEKWMREGFNIYDKNIKATDIIKRLRNEHLDAFLTSTKRI